MNERIAKLREMSLSTQETISIERARLLTEFYSTGEADKLSIPVKLIHCICKYFCSEPAET